MKKHLKQIVLAVSAVIVGIQFIRPDRTNPVSDPSKNISKVERVPAGIASIMERACRDCHTNYTVWPWYAQIAPVSWLVADDVREGRRHLNFSEWGTYTKIKKAKKLTQIAEVLGDRSMPLPKYTLIHSEAALTAEERNLFSLWAEKEADRLDDTPTDSTE